MGKVFRPSNREASILSKIESSKEHARRRSIVAARDHVEALGNAIAMKLVETQLVETTNKNSLEEQIVKCIETLCRSDDFDIDYLVAPYRQVVQHPNVVSLYVTAFLLEKLINHKSVVDIFGSDHEIYGCINKQVAKILP
jgi:hypothetical protein